MERVLQYVVGASGTGKSYFVKNTLLPQMNTGEKPILVFDRDSEYAGPGAKDVPEKWNNYRGVEQFGKMVKENGENIPKEIHVIQSWRKQDYRPIRDLLRYSEKKYRRSGEIAPFSIVLDEVKKVLNGDFPELRNALIDIARSGRKFEIDFLLISQRTIDAPKDVRSQFRDNVISFNQTLKSDIEALKKLGCENPDKVLDLKQREYHVFGTVADHIKI